VQELLFLFRGVGNMQGKAKNPPKPSAASAASQTPIRDDQSNSAWAILSITILNVMKLYPWEMPNSQG
jgi:hypothetical protein